MSLTFFTELFCLFVFGFVLCFVFLILHITSLVLCKCSCGLVNVFNNIYPIIFFFPFVLRTFPVLFFFFFLFLTKEGVPESGKGPVNGGVQTSPHAMCQTPKGSAGFKSANLRVPDSYNRQKSK